MEDDFGDDEGVYARNKSALGFIWFVSMGYSVMSKEIMSKERFVPCSVRQDLGEKINILSLVIATCKATFATFLRCIFCTRNCDDYRGSPLVSVSIIDCIGETVACRLATSQGLYGWVAIVELVAIAAIVVNGDGAIGARNRDTQI